MIPVNVIATNKIDVVSLRLLTLPPCDESFASVIWPRIFSHQLQARYSIGCVPPFTGNPTFLAE